MKRKLIGLVSGLGVGVGLVLGGLTSCASPQLSCPDIGFTPGTEHGAYQVVTYGTSCSTARALILAQQNGVAASIPLYGYRCVGIPVVPQGLAYEQFICTGLHGRAVTWHYGY